MRTRLAPLALLLAALAAPPARAEHAKLRLDAEAGGEKKTAFVDQTPPESGKNPRPVLKVKAGEPVRIEWVFTNVYPHKTLENVVMHFFVAREDKVGQKELPDLRGDVVVETAFDMDFKPGAKAGARTTLRIDQPGAYLIRVESRQTQSDHEHFAAIDIEVKAE
jgi:hypothetical protein